MVWVDGLGTRVAGAQRGKIRLRLSWAAFAHCDSLKEPIPLRPSILPTIRPHLLTPIFLILVCSSFAGLDDPGQKQITVLTEIQRGMSAVDAIPDTLEAGKFGDACNKILARNEQENTDSEGFRLGLLVRKMMRFERIAAQETATKDSRGLAAAQATLARTAARTICFGILKLDPVFELDRAFNREEVARLKAKD